MKINGVIWLQEVVDKLAGKHRVEAHEVGEVIGAKTKSRLFERKAHFVSIEAALQRDSLRAPRLGECLLHSSSICG